jgi:hypothetical protein
MYSSHHSETALNFNEELNGSSKNLFTTNQATTAYLNFIGWYVLAVPDGYPERTELPKGRKGISSVIVMVLDTLSRVPLLTESSTLGTRVSSGPRS